jgi:hypothetical protein
MKIRSLVITGILALGLSTHALAKAHFFVQMENSSSENVILTFNQGPDKEITLEPTLIDNTPLAAHQVSPKYGVNIVPMDPKATFSILFKAKNTCKFDVGFYAPGRPQIHISGLGCKGAGFKLVDGGSTVLLTISDINGTKKHL